MTELANTESKEVATMGYGAAEDISQDDCEIGRVSIMQTGSDLVKAEAAKAGEIINISDGEVLGFKKEKAFEFIIVGSYKYWIQKDADDNFISGSKQPATTQNERPWNLDDGTKNIYHHAFLVLNVADIADGFSMPYELSFRSTEVKSAKRISSILMKLRSQNIPAWEKSFLMTTEIKTKGKNSWYGSNVVLGKDSSEAEIGFAKGAREVFNISKSAAMTAHKDDSSSKPAEEAEY